MTFHFDDWVQQEFAQGEFTALIMLVEIGPDTVEPVASSYVHVIGDEIDWAIIKRMLDHAPHAWDGVAFFCARKAEGGAIPDELARLRLHDLKERVLKDRLELNTGAFFDKLGRLMKIEEAETETSSLH